MNEWLAEKLSDYAVAQTRTLAAHLDISEFRHRLSEINDTIKDAEAEAVMNGLAVGKNETERSAALRVELAKDGGYQDLVAAQRKEVRGLAFAEANRDDALASMRIIRAAIEYATADLYYQAALNGGQERKEKESK